MTVSPGRRFQLGASVVEGGVNFSVSSRRACAVELLLFDRAEDAEPARVIRLARYGDDMPEITDSKWGQQAGAFPSARSTEADNV